MGSRIILATQPAIKLTMVVFIRPTAWKIFSKATPKPNIRVKRNTTLE